MDERIGYTDGLLVPRPRTRHKRAPVEKGRDPYDGLRPWSAITHGIGAVLGVVGTVLLLARCAALEKSWAAFGAFLLYGLSMVGLYTASTLYHCLNVGVAGRIALRKYDHISIYFLIAGTYTPICLLRRAQDGGLPMLAVVWGVALAGTVMALRWIDAPRWVSAGTYLIMGWMSVFMLPGLLRNMPPQGMFWLVLGGLLYTLGGVLYAVKWPGRDPAGEHRPLLPDVSRGGGSVRLPRREKAAGPVSLTRSGSFQPVEEVVQRWRSSGGIV